MGKYRDLADPRATVAPLSGEQRLPLLNTRCLAGAIASSVVAVAVGAGATPAKAASHYYVGNAGTSIGPYVYKSSAHWGSFHSSLTNIAKVHLGSASVCVQARSGGGTWTNYYCGWDYKLHSFPYWENLRPRCWPNNGVYMKCEETW